MKTHITPILSISGSDSTGQSGLQSDVRTISALGAYALTATSCVTIQDGKGLREIYDLPADVLMKQVELIVGTMHPKAVKIGLVRDAKVMRRLRDEIVGCRNIVVAPGVYSSSGMLMMDDEALQALVRYVVPIASMLMLRCKDAEKMLGVTIGNDDDMLDVARRLHEMGAGAVLLRGSMHTEGRLTTLLYIGEQKYRFFTSHNTDGWQRHGVGGALSAAITTRLAMGDDITAAVRNAHDYMHSQVVYARGALRSVDIYNDFVSLVAEHYSEAHDVAYYADRLCITPRYLSQVTDKTVGRSPKQIVDDYVMSEARMYLRTTHLTIQEIAIKIGFTSGAMFCKFFRNHEGCSPKAFRGLFFSE